MGLFPRLRLLNEAQQVLFALSLPFGWFQGRLTELVGMASRATPTPKRLSDACSPLSSFRGFGAASAVASATLMSVSVFARFSSVLTGRRNLY